MTRRCGALTALAPLVGLCSCASSGVSQLYVKSADGAFADGRFGEAMAAYDAAHNEAPSDPAIVARRRDSAAKWVEAMAPAFAAESPPEKAVALLNALAEEGNKRGAEAAVNQHVAPLLDAAVLRVWNGDEPSNEPKVLWQAIKRGAMLTQSLPESSPARVKLTALRERGKIVFGKLAEAAKHPGTVYIYSAMVDRIADAKPSGAAVEVLKRATEFDHRLVLVPPKNCPEVEPEFRNRLTYFAGIQPRPGGLSVETDVSFNCVPLAPPTQRQASHSWVEQRYESKRTEGACRENVVQNNDGAFIETPDAYIIRLNSLGKVQSCDPSTLEITKITEGKTDLVTITTEEVGLNARGAARVVIDKVAYTMDLSARAVAEKITTEGNIFGSKEEGGSLLLDFHVLVGHGLALEVAELLELARERYVATLVKRAADEPEDARLGNMVSAVRVHQRVTKDNAKWFDDNLGFEEQDLKELVLDSPHLKMGLKVAGDYRLDMPTVDASVAREAAAAKQASGADDFK